MGLARTALFVRRSVGGLFAVEDMHVSTGARIFVHSVTGTDAGGYGSGPDKPVATLDYAIGLCTANKGDIIYVMPGHAESIITATTLTMDVAGVRVIGLGTGRLKPQFTIQGATTATWNITAANCSVENLGLISNFLNVAASITLAAGATGTTLRKINFFDTSVILGSLVGISVAAAANDLTIEGCKYYGIALTAAATNCLLCAGAAHRLIVRDFFATGSFSDAVIGASAAASTNIDLQNILEINNHATGKGINLHASTSGVADEVLAFLADATDNLKAIVGAALFMTDRVRQTNVISASPYLCIAADS